MLPADPPRLMGELLRLSLRLNAGGLSHAQRGRFVNNLATHYSRTTPQARARALRERPGILGVLKHYLENGNARAMAQAIVKMNGNLFIIQLKNE